MIRSLLFVPMLVLFGAPLHGQTVSAHDLPAARVHAFRVHWLPVLVAGQVTDVATTHVALRHGFVETNTRLYGSHPSELRLLAIKAATTAGSAYLLDRLSRRHPKLARAGVWVVGGIGAGAAAWNLRQLAREK